MNVNIDDAIAFGQNLIECVCAIYPKNCRWWKVDVLLCFDFHLLKLSDRIVKNRVGTVHLASSICAEAELMHGKAHN